MQPYFFPYIGYWQLMNAVDTYVIYDDVTFIKNGWINRNRILLNGQPHYFNLPTLGAGSYTLIKDVDLNPDKKQFSKLLKTLECAYKKAPQFRNAMPVLETIINCPAEKMIDLLVFQIREVAKYFGMKTNILVSSKDVQKDTELRAQDKVLDICKNLKATEYYNAIGGQELYSKDDFAKQGIQLHFLKTNEIVYPQFKNDFVANLSIIDVMMFCDRDMLSQIINNYDLE